MAQTERLEHTTSIAVWDVPSPLTVLRHWSVKVGAKCAEECCLAGGLIAIRDEAEEMIATAYLRSVSWDGTKALYWAEIDLPVMSRQGAHNWSAEFVPPAASASQDEAHRHHASSFRFSFLAVDPPEHTVTVRIVEAQTQNPVEDVELRLGVYRARTDRHGLALFEVPTGHHELSLWKAGHEAAPRSVAISGNVTIDVELSKAPAVEEPYWM